MAEPAALQLLQHAPDEAAGGGVEEQLAEAVASTVAERASPDGIEGRRTDPCEGPRPQRGPEASGLRVCGVRRVIDAADYAVGAGGDLAHCAQQRHLAKDVLVDQVSHDRSGSERDQVADEVP
ncbi:MAG: hypothetical protein F4059_01045 [Gemmatimonadetes bacterium]|nr:hypothetical protein [Gemmatimonadota bacterium]